MVRKIKDDDEIINLREDDSSDGAEFKINRFEDEGAEDSGGAASGGGFGGGGADSESAASKPYDKVKVKFDKFVNLIATHAYEDIFEKHMDEDVIVSTDLLADLANAHEEKENKKTPLIFVLGIVLGGVVAWILFRT